MGPNLHYSLFLLASIAFIIVASRPSEAHSRKLKSTEKSYDGFTLDDARNHLEKFGYMVPNGANGANTTTESSLEPAMRIYQKKNQLRVTGRLDSETVARMMTPRCGWPDIIESSPGKFSEHYVFNGGKWSKRKITYSFNSTIPSVPPEDLRAITARAFQRWEAVFTLQFEEAAENKVGDIKIGFYFGDHGDWQLFDGPTGPWPWAHAAAPEYGTLHLDGSELWSTSDPSTKDQVDLESVMMHMIGHTLGFFHTNEVSAIMYAYLDRGIVKRELHQDDINGIRTLYPPE